MDDLVNFSFDLGNKVLSNRPNQQKKSLGQYLTPAPIARFMAKNLGNLANGNVILDPAIGSGTLVCAMLEQAIKNDERGEIWIDGFDIDPELIEAATRALEVAAEGALKRGLKINYRLYQEDFILRNKPHPQIELIPINSDKCKIPNNSYDFIISNPPYFKLSSSDERIKKLRGRFFGTTNIYTLFMEISLQLLKPSGRACFIVPRSFCSGAYFSRFRKVFIEKSIPIWIHIFDSRKDAFKKEDVLQENIIIKFRPKTDENNHPEFIRISSSKGTTDIETRAQSRNVAYRHFFNNQNNQFYFRLPISNYDEEILDVVDSWDCNLENLGLNISTGPVVPFRSRDQLVPKSEVQDGKAVPLLWMQNIGNQSISWPVKDRKKPQGILVNNQSKELLTPLINCVLLRRFSSKEDKRRLVTAPFFKEKFERFEYIGLENHLNYIYATRFEMSPDDIVGLSALLGSSLLDRYFRIVNGNTQVNATDIRALPLPSFDVIKRIGKIINNTNDENIYDNLDKIIFEFFGDTANLPSMTETRNTMGKVKEAQEILKALGMPQQQQNDMSGLTLLAFAQITEEVPWSEAKKGDLRIHDLIQFIKEEYGLEYAENSRETFRKYVIRQFVQAGILIPNPDNPGRPTNSPLYHYVLSDECLDTVREFGTEKWPDAVSSFSGKRGSLIEMYRKRREKFRVPLRLATGEIVKLSPGKHNVLQAAIYEDFVPMFAGEAILIYLGDTRKKDLILDEKTFVSLGIPIPEHDKLPDLVLFDQERNVLFLVEAVTSRGPVSHTRYVELEEYLKDCTATRIYVTAFPDFSTFKRFIAQIAWETEVWIAEIPDHMIHFNGERFMVKHD